MKYSLYLAWRYLAYHRAKTCILVLSITLIVYVPAGLRILVAESSEQLTARAVATPLLIGKKGSPLETVLNSLYFSSDRPEPMRFAEVERIARTGLAQPVPLYTRFRAGQRPIVGTTLDYFTLRGLRVASGGHLAMLGDCIVGARVAEESEIVPGDRIVSSPETVFDLAGVYPLSMRVTGVLERSGTPDDDAIFVDLKTTWVIEGLGHGHRDLAAPEAASDVLSRDGNRVAANAAVVQYTEIDAENVESFHFHGDRAEYPISAIIAAPPDAKSAALLRGRYESSTEAHQIIRPVAVIEELLSTILTVQKYVVAAVILVGTSTLLTSVLVFLLSLRLRQREIETLIKIGGSRARIASVMSLEILSVLAISAALAGVLTLLTARYGSEFVRALLMS